MSKQIKQEIYNKIKEYNTIIIHTHIRPDGDTLGSAIGLKEVILSSFSNKKVYVVGDKSNYLSFLGEVDDISDDSYKDALVIVVDTATRDRVADQRFTLGKYLIKIDHHLETDKYGDLQLVYTNYPATAQIIIDFIYDFKDLKINNKAKEALFTGVYTDTGGFKYRGVNDTTFNLMAKLFSDNFNHSKLVQKIETVSEKSILIKQNLFNNIVKDKKVIYSIAKYKFIKDNYLPSSEVSMSVDELSRFEKYPLYCLFIEQEDKSIRIRLRSKDKPINEIAAKYNGGGHALACGATIYDESDIKNVINDLNNLYKE